MPRTRNRGTLQVFSTSFVDTMCVALAGQLILWTISNDNPHEKRQPPFCSFSVAQTGADHLEEIRVVAGGQEMFRADNSEIRYWLPDGTSKRLSAAAAKVPSPKGGEIGYFRQKRNAEWAGRMTLSLSGISEPVDLHLRIKRCTDPSTVHFIALDCFSSISAVTNLLFFTLDSRLASAIQNDSVGVRMFREYASPDRRSTSVDLLRQRIQFLDDSTEFRTIILSLSRSGRISMPNLQTQRLGASKAEDLLSMLKTRFDLL